MPRRDEFDDEGFLDSLLNRKGNADLPPGLRRIFIVIGVLVVFSVLAAVVVSAWPDGSPDADEAVPIIRADPQPFKVKPEEPGGMNVPNKDSTIFETLKGEVQEAKTENLLEDSGDTSSAMPKTETLKAEAVGAAEKAPAAEPPESAMPPQPAAPFKVEPSAVKEPAKEGSIIDTLKSDNAPADVKPPEEKKTVPTSAPVKAPASGSSYVQLAAVKSESEAAALWSKAKAKNPELAALSMRTQKVDVAGQGTLYRVQAGPVSKDAAASICGAVKSRGGSCITK